MVTVELPSPSIDAPPRFSAAATSTTSGSLAAFSMTVLPQAREAAMMRLIVAPTLGTESMISSPSSLSALASM